MDEANTQSSYKFFAKSFCGIALILFLNATTLGIAFAHLFPGPQSTMGHFPIAVQIAIAIAAAPLVETAILVLGIEWCLKINTNRRLVAALMAAIFGFLHKESITWGTHALLAFYIMAHVYLKNSKRSRIGAYLKVSSIHAVANAALFAFDIIIPDWLV